MKNESGKAMGRAFLLVENDRQMCMIVYLLLWNNTNDWRKWEVWFSGIFFNKKIGRISPSDMC